MLEGGGGAKQASRRPGQQGGRTVFQAAMRFRRAPVPAFRAPFTPQSRYRSHNRQQVFCVTYYVSNQAEHCGVWRPETKDQCQPPTRQGLVTRCTGRIPESLAAAAWHEELGNQQRAHFLFAVLHPGGSHQPEGILSFLRGQERSGFSHSFSKSPQGPL